MAARTLGRVARRRYLSDVWLPPVYSSQSLFATRGSGEIYSDSISSSACLHNLADCSCWRLASCLRHVHSRCSYPRVSSWKGDFGGCTNSAGGLVLSRPFAAKKSKSRCNETVEVVEDVPAGAKESATKLMEMALEVLSREHSKLRTGRASSGMLDHITVEAHGVRTPLIHIAAVSVAGLQTLNVLPYDPSMVKEVEKALLMSPLGLNPAVEGSTLTVPLPRLTKEVCESMCKLAVKAGETAKLSIRRARKDALDRVRSAGLSKDEMKRFEKEVEELTKKYVKSTDELCKKKEKEILS